MPSFLSENENILQGSQLKEYRGRPGITSCHWSELLAHVRPYNILQNWTNVKTNWSRLKFPPCARDWSLVVDKTSPLRGREELTIDKREGLANCCTTVSQLSLVGISNRNPDTLYETSMGFYPVSSSTHPSRLIDEIENHKRGFKRWSLHGALFRRCWTKSSVVQAFNAFKFSQMNFGCRCSGTSIQSTKIFWS